MLTKDNNYKVMRLFFLAPEKRFHIRELARLTKLSPPGVTKILKRLKKAGLLISKRYKNLEEFEISRIDKYYREKVRYNIESLFASGLMDFLRDKYDEPQAIILFGSYSNGMDISISDIDIAVITKLDKSDKLDFRKYSKQLGREINVMEIEIKHSGNGFLNNLANGIKLHGYVEWVK
jgi:DNA-binding transcriptional ArsR family regulator